MQTTAIICIFIVGYIMIAMENVTKVKKSAVALLMAVLCWTLLYLGAEAHPENISAFTKTLGETSEIIFFLMGAMVIVEVVNTNGGFDFVRDKLVSRSKVSLHKIDFSILLFLLESSGTGSRPLYKDPTALLTFHLQVRKLLSNIASQIWMP